MITAKVGDKVRLTGYGLLRVLGAGGRAPAGDKCEGVVEGVGLHDAMVYTPTISRAGGTKADHTWFLVADEFLVVKEEV